MAESIKATTRSLPVIDDADYNTTDEAPVDASEFQTVGESEQESLPLIKHKSGAAVGRVRKGSSP